MEIETYKWDYTFEGNPDKLKELGKQGWEVCGSHVYTKSSFNGSVDTSFLLKRPCGRVKIVTRDQSRNDGYENER